MYDESTNTSSGAVLSLLKEECARLSRIHSDKVTEYYYPNIHILAKEHAAGIAKMSPLEIVQHCGRHNKIGAIKMVREKFSNLPLKEAKFIVDGYFKELGWCSTI